MKDFISEYWLSVIVGVYLLGMILYGHYKGLIRIAVSLVAIFASLIFVRIGMPYVTGYMKENTGIHRMVEDTVLKAVGYGLERGVAGDSGFGETESDESGSGGILPDVLPAAQRQLIEQMNLPDTLKDALIENNNSEVYQLLGVQHFSEYIANYLSNLIFNAIGFIILYLLSYVVIRLMMSWLDLVARLPIIHGMNQIAGAVLGGLEGLIILCILGLIVTVCSGTGWGRIVVAQIEGSPMLLFLYSHNFLQWIVFGMIGSIL